MYLCPPSNNELRFQNNFNLRPFISSGFSVTPNYDIKNKTIVEGFINKFALGR